MKLWLLTKIIKISEAKTFENKGNNVNWKNLNPRDISNNDLKRSRTKQNHE